MVTLRREVRATHGHLDAAVSHQFGNHAGVNPRHNQPTCKRMPIAMPGVIFDSGFRQRLVEPASVVVLRILVRVTEDVHWLARLIKVSSKQAKLMTVPEFVPENWG